LKVLSKKDFTATDFTSVVVHLFAAMAFLNWQRPSGLINMKKLDAENAAVQDNNFLIKQRL
jgi:hypothetical protein